MYDIKIDYTTRYKSGYKRETAMLCNPVTSLDDAKNNLKRIKEHYILCRDDPYCGKQCELIIKDDHGELTITPFWTDFFDTLHGAEILDDDIRFEL